MDNLVTGGQTQKLSGCLNHILLVKFSLFDPVTTQIMTFVKQELPVFESISQVYSSETCTRHAGIFLHLAWRIKSTFYSIH